MKLKYLILIIFFPNFINSQTIDIYCRDSQSGIFLNCDLNINNKKYSLNMGKNVFSFEEGLYFFEVLKDGYKDLNTSFSFPNDIKEISFYLDPLEEFKLKENQKQKTLILGHIFDKEEGIPLEGVKIYLENIVYESDVEGYFEIEVPSFGFSYGEEIPTLNIHFSKNGYKDIYLERILNIEQSIHFIIDMKKGEGFEKLKNEHHFFHQNEEKEIDLEDNSSYFPNKITLSNSLPPQQLLIVIDPPNTIRVGMNCSCTTCSSVDVLTLETYVKRGLNDEWIASWNTHSLRAGSIAYRSYGAYYVYHPINPNYDICSSTCCQVNDTDTSSSTNTATDKTAGILLQRSGSIFRSEYSAENNSWDDPNDGLSCTNSDLSCGNGYAGSPATSWPCLSDSPCTNYGCFGHGRGMCQWGTQRWANNNSKLWKWIVNHYYNNEGNGSGLRTAYMTSPISINSVSANPSTISPGGSFTINLSATSYAEISHPQIMIGASLYSTSTGYISDPPNDNKITLAPGSNAPSRTFQTPSNTPKGFYDLIVALWLDVDEDNTITGNDLSLVTYTLASAIEVSGVLYGTCTNPFIISSFPFNHSYNNNSNLANLSNYNCNSLRDSSSKEVVYKLNITIEGILQATLSPSSPLDLYLTKTCSNLSCLAYGDSTIFEKNLQPGEYYIIVDGNSNSSYTLNINFTQKDTSIPSDNYSLRLVKSTNQLLLSWTLPDRNIFGGPENISKTNIFRGTNPQNLIFITNSNGTSILLNDLSSSENYFYRLSFEDTSGNRSLPCHIETIVDNVEANFEGSWAISTSQPDRWGVNYSYAWGSANDLNRAHFLPFLQCINKNYNLYIYYPAFNNRCTSTKLTINHNGGSSTLYIDQTSNGGKWNMLGTYFYDKNYETIISDGVCTSSKAVIADALRWLPSIPSEFILDDDSANFVGDWVYTVSSYGYNGDYYWRSTGGNGSNYALWIPYLYESGSYDIFVWYRSGANRTISAPYTITTATGDTTIYVNQQINGSQWFYIGNFDLNPSTAKIKISDSAQAGYVVIADAVKFVKN